MKTLFTVFFALHVIAYAGDSKSPPADYNQLAKGAWRVRLLPTAKNQILMISICGDETYTKRCMEAVNRFRLGDAWYAATNAPKVAQIMLDSGLPTWIFCNNNAVMRRKEGYEPKIFATVKEQLDYADAHWRGRRYTFCVGEWENYFWRFWDANGQEEMLQAAYGITPAQRDRLDRKGFYEAMTRAVLRWKDTLRGRMTSQSGYAMFNHLAAEAKCDYVGIETGETIPASQVKRAIARGASRQYDVPWWDDVSAFFGDSMASGKPCSPPRFPNGIYVGPNSGHSPSMLERLWYTGWFSGAAGVMIEGSWYLFDMAYDTPYNVNVFPVDVGLSPYGVLAQKLAALTRSENIGVPYTPFAVLLNKYHGRWSVWGKPWGYLEKTVGDDMTERFFDQVFPGQSKGAGREERYLVSSPYGDTFDVLVNNAQRSAWSSYPVILAVGDIPWTPDDIGFLKRYVEDGGTLALNEINIGGWQREYLGLAAEGFAPSSSAKATMVSPAGRPLLIECKTGKGRIFVASKHPENGVAHEMAFPTAFLRQLADQYLPVRVEGNVETLINRTADGWAVMLVNNNGFTKEPTEAPKIDLSKTERVRVSFQGSRPTVSELYAGEKINCAQVPDGGTWKLSIDVKPGELRILKIVTNSTGA